MAKYSADLFQAPAAAAVRQVGLLHLEAARVARQRLDGGDDEEALHDFRVALRRLRSLLRAFRPVLDSVVSGKLRRRLRDLARLTGTARDAEVRLAWARDARRRLPASRRAGVAWWIAQLAEQRDGAYRELHKTAVSDFDKILPRVRRALTTPSPEEAPGTFGQAVGERVGVEAGELGRRLALIQSIADEAEAHGARIEVKRIRYLLEPLATERRIEDLLKSLRQAQDALGALHDIQAIGTTLGEAAAEAAAERTRERHRIAMRRPTLALLPKRRPKPSPTGLLALAGLARGEEERLFRHVRRGRVLRALPGELAALASHLAAPAPTPATTPVLPAEAIVPGK
ncbi:MAG TPA: CHAD domain-containing protein [Gemmatimonadales bacterium]|nr:CHAD domain-containing protein [Gemmatimonadales bacterium]